jgi:hypothetical protein
MSSNNEDQCGQYFVGIVNDKYSAMDPHPLYDISVDVCIMPSTDKASWHGLVGYIAGKMLHFELQGDKFDTLVQYNWPGDLDLPNNVRSLSPKKQKQFRRQVIHIVDRSLDEIVDDANIMEALS